MFRDPSNWPNDVISQRAYHRQATGKIQTVTIETEADGAIGITFADGTAFGLSTSARTVLNGTILCATRTGASTLFGLLQGPFAFIAGKATKTGSLQIDTPLRRSRGTARDGGVGILTLGALTFSLIDEIQAASGHDTFLDDGTITYKDAPHGTFEIVTRDGRVVVADDPGETIVVDPTGSVTRIPNTSSRMAELQLAQQTALATWSQQGQQGAAPGGSSTSTFESPLQLERINFNQLQDHGPVSIIPATTPGIMVPPSTLPIVTPPATTTTLATLTVAISAIAGDVNNPVGAIINASKADAGFDIKGSASGVTNGQAITVQILDGSGQVKDVYATTVTDSTWLVNVSAEDAKALADGTYTVMAILSVAGNMVQDSRAIEVEQKLGEHPSVLVNGGSPTPIVAPGSGQVAFTISGLASDDSGTLTFSDHAGHALVVTVANGQAVDSQGHLISTANLSSLSDGTITSSLVVGDPAGNQFSASGNAVPLEQKLGEHPSVLVNGGSPTPIGAAGAGQVAFMISELTSDDSGTLTFSDHAGHALVVAVANGHTVDSQGHPISEVNLSSLSDGTITSSLSVGDPAGNQFSASGNTVPLEQKLGEHPSVLVNGGSPTPIGAAGAGQVAFMISGLASDDSGTLTFSDHAGHALVVAVANGQAVDSKGHPISDVNLSSLSDGTITSSLAVGDPAGNQFSASGNAVPLDQDLDERPIVSFDGLTGGHAVEDQIITAIVTDADNDVPTSGITYAWQISHDGGNTWSTVGGNARSYAPSETDEGGLLKVVASFTDGAGNTESGSSTVGVLPLVTIANSSLSVSPNGSVPLGISLTQEPTPDDTISVSISFHSSGAHDPTITAGDHANGDPHTSGGITTYTFSLSSVDSGLIFANHGDQSDVLTVNEILNGIVATSQTITVTDPPISPSDTIAPDPIVSATSEDRSVQSTHNDLIASSSFTEALNGKGEHSAFLFRTDLDRDRIADPQNNFVQIGKNPPLQLPGDKLLHPPAQIDDDQMLAVTDGAHTAHLPSYEDERNHHQFVFNANFGRDVNAGIEMTHIDQPVFQTVADILTQTAEAGLDVIVSSHQNQDVISSFMQKDKLPIDFIMHG